jgi:hypothetical protein
MNAGAGAAAQAAAIAQAIKASGVLVKVKPDDFRTILSRIEQPLVVTAEGGFLSGYKHRYMTSYKGLTFFTDTPEPMMLPGTAEIVVAEGIWIPG